ncbi:hypothetical protein HanHA300_Chr15g0555851 [Helianthus annuus]|nr:hypothetical protein HanHA300_Chr15g0555851 [Helianthus annuus]
MNSAAEDVLLEKGSVLDQSLDALYEKRGSTREKALVDIIDAFSSSLPHDFVVKKFTTLLHQCLQHSFSISCHWYSTFFSFIFYKVNILIEVSKQCSICIGLLALTAGPSEKAQEILEESVTPISEALRSRSKASKTASLLGGLAVIAFVGGNEPEETEKCMQIMWQVVHPKLGPNICFPSHFNFN